VATILVGDRDSEMVEGSTRTMTREGYLIVLASEGREVIASVRRREPDAVIIGDGLPDLGPGEICKQLREESTVPIVVIGAVGDEFARVLALELGADNYLTKPISPRELLAQIRAIFRRIRFAEQRLGERHGDILRDGDLDIDLLQHQVRCASEVVPLLPKEFSLLAFLVGHPDVVHTREQLLAAAWGDAFTGSARTVDAHIRELRKKIEADPSNPERIQTILRVGYIFVSHARR
jgi:two-component system, OmpR family, alkaline phosphatase synthesis response regulator PhoP